MSRFLLGAILLSCTASGPFWAQSVPVGPEFQVNTFTFARQDNAAVAVDGSGNFVVVWSSPQDGSGGIFGQRFDSAGAPRGSEFQINTYTTYDQNGAAVAVDGSGSFVVVWQSRYQDGSSFGIFGQRFDGAGLPQGSEFQVNTYATSGQYRPAVAVDGSGNFVVVWDGYQDGDSSGIFGRRFDSAGLPRGTEFQVNTYTTSYQISPAVAVDGPGSFVVVWLSAGQDGSGRGIFAQRFDSGGAPQGSEFQVNTYTTDFQSTPAVAVDGSGNFVVVWSSFNQDGSGYGIFAQRFDSAGLPRGSEFQVNTYTTDTQDYPAVAVDGSGEFVVVWHSFTQDGWGYGIFAQRFDGTGAPQGNEFQVNTYTPYYQRYPAAAFDGSGNFVVAWQSDRQDGSFTGVFAQRFCNDADADGVCDITDNCASVYNPTQDDVDADGLGDDCDNCNIVYNPSQQDGDSDGDGDICDNCLSSYNPTQQDTDGDGKGDVCDNCYAVLNPSQDDLDSDGLGDNCDNCVSIYNPTQTDSDNQPEGDACDLTVTFPLDPNDVNCSGAPPTITWSAETYDRFKVFVATTPAFTGTGKTTSGDKLLKTAYWMMPAKKWAKVCSHTDPLSPDIYIRVWGKTKGTNNKEYAEVVMIPVF